MLIKKNINIWLQQKQQQIARLFKSNKESKGRINKKKFGEIKAHSYLWKKTRLFDVVNKILFVYRKKNRMRK